jgi:hypothetical protein
MEQQNIPYFAHEGIMARMERTIKRLWVLCIILIILLAGSNGSWLWYESQFTDEEMTVTQDSENGTNNFVGEDGNITNGTTDNNP